MKLPEMVTSPRNRFLLAFLLGFLVRFLPEVLAYPNLIGFDTVYCAARLERGVIWHHWSEIFTQTWLLFGLLVPIDKITGLTPAMALRISSSAFYGLNVAGIYYFANKSLKWNSKKSFLASILFSFSIASLRISWDLYRNILGLGLLLFAIAIMPEAENGKKIPSFVLLSILITFSHELTTVTLLALSSGLIILNIKRSERTRALNLFIAVLPALAIFLVRTYLTLYPILYTTDTNIIDVGDMDYARLPGFFFLTDYLKISITCEQYSTYAELSAHILSLFFLLYVVLIPLIAKGFFRVKILDLWTALLLIGSFNALITPFAAVIYWERWMFMLIYPFTFYAANGVEEFLRNKKWIRQTKAIIILTMAMGILFMASPSAYPIPTTVAYFPSGMQQNTIPLEDESATISSITWLNQNMNTSTCVIVHLVFVSWADLYLNKNLTIIYYSMNLTRAFEVARRNGFQDIYIVWWNRDIGWYPNIKLPQGLKEVYSDGRISTYRYAAS